MGSGASSRYDTILKLAAGGMATVWVGNARGALGFRQLVAIKKPHPHLLADATFRSELVAEARLASLIRHANVVDVRDVEVDGDAISLVMDYIEGASLGDLIATAAQRGAGLAPRVAVRIALDALAGLHAAHELVDERGRHVGLVHRDVSPQNILVGVDGLARVADFGVAKFSRKGDSSDGGLKGKLAYMAPEYVRGESIDRRFDVFALGVVLWESLVGKRLFRGANEAETLRLLLQHEPESLVTAAPAAAALDGILKTALARPVAERFQNAQAMAAALETTALAAGLCGGHTEVAAALKDLVGASIEERRTLVRASLAHEPSLASLMGEAAPRAVTDAAIARANDDAKAAAPTGVTSPMLGAPALLGVTSMPNTSVPSTMPMTPRMDGAPPIKTQALAPAPALALALSPATSPMHLVAAAPGSGSTLASAPTLLAGHVAPTIGSSPRIDATADTQLAFNEPSARSAVDVVAKPPTSKALPVLLALALLAVAGGAIVFGAKYTSKSSAADTPPPAASSVAVTTTMTAEPPAATAAASAAPVVTPSASATSPVAAPAVTAMRRVTKPAAAAAAAAAATTSTASPSSTSKKPPPNPYANE